MGQPAGLIILGGHGLTPATLRPLRMTHFTSQQAFHSRRPRLCQNYPLIWIGDLFLKKFEVRMEIRFVYGDPAVFGNSAPSFTFAYPGIYVKKKMKFGNLPQKYLKQKMQAKTGICVLIALPSDGKVAQCLQRFIRYFKRKKSVGVSLLPQDGKPAFGLIHAPFFCCHEMLLFPPSEFAHQNILPLAPQFTELLERQQTPYLMLVISAFHCLRCAKLLRRCA